ncbi:MAG: hypothetical protein NTW86_12225, partial [Candidatus Sumerlaeota bacterium]|nr:hypothetical protein [Candidatus Sumerlaeota bacterium]
MEAKQNERRSKRYCWVPHCILGISPERWVQIAYYGSRGFPTLAFLLLLIRYEERAALSGWWRMCIEFLVAVFLWLGMCCHLLDR